MGCMLPLIKRKQMIRGKSRMRVNHVEKDSRARLANVETGEALRLSEPTSEHAGDTDCQEGS